MGIELNKDQINASLLMENWWYSSNDQVFEVSGAAGTGKTTLVRYLIDRIGLSLDEVLFVAYMGKAATCMQRNGLPAKTMHSAMYKYEKCIAVDETGKPIYNENGLPKLELRFKLKKSIGENIKLIVVDEGSTVNSVMAEDLLSFGIPVIVLGDLNQLPPVMGGKSFFLNEPNIILKQIMRQAENSPIVYLSQLILNNQKLHTGIYGSSAVINKDDINEYNYRKNDIVLTCTNRLRAAVNETFRTQIKKLKRLDVPNKGEQIICRKNNWGKSLDGIVLTNGCTGFIDDINISTLREGIIELDFRPDYSILPYKSLKTDFAFLMGREESKVSRFDYSINKFEFGYAITVHLSQGSQWDDVLFLAEPTKFPEDIRKKLMYTAITRAAKSITVAI